MPPAPDIMHMHKPYIMLSGWYVVNRLSHVSNISNKGVGEVPIQKVLKFFRVRSSSDYTDNIHYPTTGDRGFFLFLRNGEDIDQPD